MVPIASLQRFMAARVPSTLPAGTASPGAPTAMPGTNFMMEPVTMPPGAAMAPGAAYAAPTMGTMGSMPPMMGMMPPTYAAPPTMPTMQSMQAPVTYAAPMAQAAPYTQEQPVTYAAPMAQAAPYTQEQPVTYAATLAQSPPPGATYAAPVTQAPVYAQMPGQAPWQRWIQLHHNKNSGYSGFIILGDWLWPLRLSPQCKPCFVNRASTVPSEILKRSDW